MRRLVTGGLLTLLLAQPAWSRELRRVTDYLSLETGRVITPGHATLGLGIGVGPQDYANRPVTTNGYALRFRYGVGHSS